MEYLIWGLLPVVIALGSIVLSARSFLRQPTAIQAVLSLLAIPAASWALWVLKRILMDRAWPTFLPHFVIAAAVAIVAVQTWLGRRAGSNRKAA